ncbi:MAG: methyltransferase domain-containing protein [Chloroflexota bacterium]
METFNMDVWGEIYKDHHAGKIQPHHIERDDGYIDEFESGEHYFAAVPRTEGERVLLDRLQGPVLDLGGGVGTYALYLEERGIDAIHSDGSLGALEVARARGCLKAEQIDINNLNLPDQAFGSIIIMGNTLGLNQTVESLPQFL